VAAPEEHVPIIPPGFESELLACEHARGFVPGSGELAAGFGVGVEAATGKRLGDVVPAGPGGDAEPVFVVHAEVERFVEAPEFFVDAAAPPDGGLAEEVAFGEAGWGEGAGVFQAFAAGGFEEKEVGVDDVCVGVLRKGGVDFLEGVGFVEVVSAEVGEEVAAGKGEAFIDGVGLAAVGFGNPADFGMGAQDFEGGVGGGSVDDEVFDRMAVGTDGAEAFGEIGALVEGGGDDGELHEGLMGTASPREWDACGDASLPFLFDGALTRRCVCGGIIL